MSMFGEGGSYGGGYGGGRISQKKRKAIRKAKEAARKRRGSKPLKIVDIGTGKPTGDVRVKAHLRGGKVVKAHMRNTKHGGNKVASKRSQRDSAARGLSRKSSSSPDKRIRETMAGRKRRRG